MPWFTQPLRKSFTASEFASNDNSQDRCDRRQIPLNLRNFNSRLLMCLSQIRNMWLLGWRARFRSTGRISTFAHLMRRGQCANMWRARFRFNVEHCSGYTFRPTTWHLRIIYVDCANAGFARSDSTSPRCRRSQAISPFVSQ